MNSQLRKNLVFNTAGSLLFYVCQAAMNLLVTALAGAAANGLLATAMTIANVGLSFASYGMRTFQVSDEAGKYTDRTYLASRFVTVALAWAACMGFAFVNAYTSRQRWVIFLYTGYRLVESASDVWHGFLQKAERMDIVGISFGVRGVFTAGAVVGGLLLTHDLVITLAVLLALNLGYVVLVDVPLARRRADLGRTGGKSVPALLWECLPLAAYASLNTAVGSAPRYFCERILGEVMLSYFANVFLPVMMLQVAAVYLFVPFITTFSRLWNGKDRAGYFKALRMLGLCLAVLWAAGTAGVLVLGHAGNSGLHRPAGAAGGLRGVHGAGHGAVQPAYHCPGYALPDLGQPGGAGRRPCGEHAAHPGLWPVGRGLCHAGGLRRAGGLPAGRAAAGGERPVCGPVTENKFLQGVHSLHGGRCAPCFCGQGKQFRAPDAENCCA